MSVIQTSVSDNLVWYDGAYPHRWLDAMGPNVVKVIEEFQQTPFDGADAPSEWTTTLVETGAGETTLALVGGALGGELLITTDAADNDGANMQAKGEAFTFSAAYKAYFGVRYKISDATQSDFLAGLCITDTDLLGGMTDGIYFRKVDAGTAVSFVMEKDSVETEIASVDVQVANTFAVLEFTYDGTYVNAYVDGVKVGQILASNANFPNDEYLTPSIHFLTGEAVVKTANIDWIRAIQIQA